MTVVDPTKTNDGFEMDVIEFVECIARLSEMASLLPLCISQEDEDDWPYERRFSLPLHIKCESLIALMMENYGTKFMKRDYWPTGTPESIFSDTFKLEDDCIYF